MRINKPKKHIEKLKNAILYILNKIGGRPNIGQTVIYKLLYFIDFDYYEKYEEQIIGATYKKNNHGPTPNEFNDIIKEMKKKKAVKEIEGSYFGKRQKRYIANETPNIEVFSAREIKHIDEVLDKHGHKTAKELSDLSHIDIPYIVTKDKENIDYETVFYRNPETSVRNDQI